MKTLSAFTLGVLTFALAGTTSADEKDYPKDIVGKWEITKTSSDAPVGTLIEFLKDGKLTAVLKIEGQELKIDGTYKVDKDKLMTKIKLGDQTVEDTDTIKKLADDTLELEDKDKKTTTLKRKK